MKRLIAALVTLIVIVAGCYSGPPGQEVNVPGSDYGTFTESSVTLNGGKVIHCLFWTHNLGGQSATAAMSCNWTGQ